MHDAPIQGKPSTTCVISMENSSTGQELQLPQLTLACSIKLYYTPTYNLHVTKCILDTMDSRTLTKQDYKVLGLNGTPYKTMAHMCKSTWFSLQSCIEWVWDLHNNSLDHLGLIIKKREFAFQMRLPFSKPRIPWLKVVRFKDIFTVNSPGTKRVGACVRNATARHACIVRLDRTAIFKVKSSCLSRSHCFLFS